MFKRWMFLLCCLSLASLVLAGCGDDEPNEDNDTMTDMGGDSDATGCTDAECAAMGQVCNMTTGMCEAQTGDQCAASGDVCDPAVAQPAGFVCVDATDGGICATACDANDTYSCAEGAICLEGACLESDCTHFFDNDCAAGEKCIPRANKAFFCVPAGMGTDGEACMGDSDCVADGLCLPAAGDTFACGTPDCSPATATRTCPAGQQCDVAYVFNQDPIDPLDASFCYTPCTPWASNDGCEAGQWCSPGSLDGAVFTGVCTDDTGGTAGPGDACDNATPATTCGTPAGMPAQPTQTCVRFSETEATCLPLCNPEAMAGADGACGMGEICVANLQGVDYGTCDTACDPWAAMPDPACEMGEYCFPSFRDPAVGTCTPNNTGTKVEGEACAEDTECANGMICGGDDTCAVVCDVRAMPGTPAGCEGMNQFCGVAFQNPDTMMLLDLGLCRDGCEYDHMNKNMPIAGCDMGEVCQFAAMNDEAGDFCQPYSDAMIAAGPPLAEFADCPADTEFQACGPGALCLDIDGITTGVQCVQMCDFGQKPAGQSDHPDCDRSTAVCQQLFTGLQAGICGNDGM